MGKVYFLTGSNRGIGLETLKILSSDSTNTVIGTARDLSNAKELAQLAQERDNIKIVELDVSSQESINQLNSQLESVAPEGIDTFISNAAIAQTHQPALSVERDVYLKHYITNVVGPIELTKVLKPYLDKRETKQIIFISSIVGSLSNFVQISTAAYGQSKSALNHAVLTLSFELKDDGYTIVAVHPGVVSSDMLNQAKIDFSEFQPEAAKFLKDNSITTEQSASYQINNVYHKLTKEDNGKFFSYDGSEIPY
ncbi:3-oxoacyl-[acyl-carrier-protein] reductase [Wickerhamomyces ciferrii]|uniref:3-oxoacyl-[acyl-carrier-protein] reductase n=1 Tax=Wickerhamomyces ciferrii (strain ATCC 14091 / BCRC 22168 / CBS 111 / JCM 3599 / NBRC 0793 / NRRL Y-1031 F-60-10) TaxID=1206466 RepID=K0KMG0_WICCF|nr:3-oxoacyl-[acyl-carrier-protein] reductase [Wickerhamomyces ciferrii]CCH42564.1 3-oxoacyl-[acyl-carrier-protein] reductase [Wickerhamomyces ciferrii]